MFFPEGQVRVYVYGAPADMRRSFDGLHALTAQAMKLDPLSGHLFAFINRRGTMIKVLYWDRSGWCLWGIEPVRVRRRYQCPARIKMLGVGDVCALS